METPKTPIQRACDPPLSQAKLAAAIDVSPAFMNQMYLGKRPVPVELGAAIERVSGVSRRELFPTKWQRIWPELEQGGNALPTTNSVAAAGA